MIVKSKVVGIIGGGQLGMMLADEIHKLGGKVVSLDPDESCPSHSNADEFICASYDSLEDLKKLSELSDVITYEFENVKSEYLIELEKTGKLKQGLNPLFDSQDRLREKENAIKHGLTPVKFYDVLTLKDLEDGINKLGYPCLYKTRTLGYDGHGQVLLKSDEDIEKVKPYLENIGILEEYLEFDYEVSVIMIRDSKKVIALPISRNIHKKGILDITYLPANIDKALEEKIISSSKKFMESANYEGILCIEYFVKGDKFYFNEMAPRPHNSGHYSIEGTTHSQYELFARYLLGLDLVESELVGNVVMKNILGDDMWMVPHFKDIENAYIHLYNKKEVRPARKMGHVTITNITVDDYLKLEKDMWG